MSLVCIIGTYPQEKLEKERHMFTTVSILLVILAGLCTALYKVTYPTCTARRCNHTHTA